MSVHYSIPVFSNRKSDSAIVFDSYVCSGCGMETSGTWPSPESEETANKCRCSTLPSRVALSSHFMESA